MATTRDEAKSAYFLQVGPGGICFAHGPFETQNCPLWPDCATDRQKPEYIAMDQKEVATQSQATEFQKINQEWVKGCEIAMSKCPGDFITHLTELMFLGQRLITEARIVAQIDAHKAALSQR